MKYDELIGMYPSFIYHSYKITALSNAVHIEFDFEIENLTHFNPTWTIPVELSFDVSDPIFEQLVFSIGMVELVSYWKATCSPNVEVKCGYLSDEQKNWWKKLYFNGLGEFFYTNGVTPNMDSFMNITTIEKPQNSAEITFNKKLDGYLVPVGGGKDSIVSLHLLKEEAGNNKCFMINHRNSAFASALLAGFKGEDIIKAKRTLDKRLIDLNKKGFLNGHTPLSALIAFSAVTIAYIWGQKYVVLSNESSANEPSVENSTINHQYSKSFEFENDLATYIDNFIPCGVKYFSLLRPLTELQISAIFSQLKEYHQVFRSCNQGNAGLNFDTWCLRCSKCLFVAMILSPFLSDTELKEIFRKNLLDDESFQFYFRQLVGMETCKPFECVGSIDEINHAVCMAIKKREAEGVELPYLYKYYITTEQYEKYRNLENPYKDSFDEVNLIPEHLLAKVKKTIAEYKW